MWGVDNLDSKYATFSGNSFILKLGEGASTAPETVNFGIRCNNGVWYYPSRYFGTVPFTYNVGWI